MRLILQIPALMHLQKPNVLYLNTVYIILDTEKDLYFFEAIHHIVSEMLNVQLSI